MIKLLNLNKTVVRYLPKYRDLSVTEELKTGDQTLTFTLLEHNPSDIANEWYIETADARYVIKETEKTMDDYPSYTCQLDLEDLEQTMFEQFTAANKTAAQAAALAIAGTGWTVTSTMTKKRSVQSFKLTPLQALGKIRDAFMCDLWFDSLNKVVHLEEQRGEDKGVYFLAGLNLKDLKTTVDNYDYYTRLIPIGKDDLRINAVNAGVGYVENYQYSNKIRTLIWEDTSYEDANILKEDAIAKLADLSKPKKSYKASVRDLAKQKPGYSILSYALGDTVTIADRSTGTRDAQRIVKLVRYPDSPEKNTCELSNTVLTFEEQQDRLNAAAAAWESVSNTDGTVNGVWVHGVRAGDVVGVEVTTGGSTTTTDLNNAVSIMQGDTAAVVSDLQAATARIGTIETTYLTAANAEITYATITDLDAATADIHDLSADYASFKSTATDELTAHQAIIDALDSTYASITTLDAQRARIDVIEANYMDTQMSNIDIADIHTASIKDLFVSIGLIKNASISGARITGYLDTVKVSASDITTGTLTTDRLVIRGNGSSIVYALNNLTGAVQAQNVNTINGEVLTPRTITADRIVTNSITANEIAAGTITADEIAASTITAAKLSVTQLSAITANMGTITGGTLKLGTNAVTQLNNDGTGHIGAWNFDASKLYNGTYGSDSSVYFSTANMGSKAIGGRTGADWRLTIGSKFGVTNTGALYGNAAYFVGGTIGGWTLSASKLSASKAISTSVTETVEIDSANRKITLSSSGTVNGTEIGVGTMKVSGAASTATVLASEVKIAQGTNVPNPTYSSVTATAIYEAGTALSSKYAAKSHGNHVPATQTASNKVFLRNDNTWQTVTPANIGAAAASHGNHVPATQTASNKVFLRNDNTWATVTPANIGAAASSHGNHVPATQTASNKVFLRNDNTWQTVTPANIGAAASSHSHSYLPLSGGTVTGAATFNSSLAVVGNMTNTGWIFLRGADPSLYFANNKQTSYTNRIHSISANTLEQTSASGDCNYLINASGTSEARCQVKNGGHFGALLASSGNNFGLYSQLSGKTGWLIKCTSAGAVTVSSSVSDIRLKENIRDTDVTDALSVIDCIRIRQFDWKETGEHQKIGFVADELETLDSHLAFGGGEDEFGNLDKKNVDTFYLIGYLVKAVQELSTQVKQLKKAG